MNDLSTYDGPGRVITSIEKLDELHQQINNTPTVVFDSGFQSLDFHLGTMYPGTELEKYVGAFKGGQLVVVSGDEGEGKSSFCRTLTRNLEQQNARCLWFSYEERPDEFLSKFGDRVPYFLLPAELEMQTTVWIRERVKEAKLKYKTLHALFIDHLHYLTDEVETGSLSNDLGRICRKLKLIGVEENVIVFLICHTNRSESAEEPGIRSLRDSGMIGKEADIVLFVGRNADDTSKVKTAKCRATGAKNKVVYFEKKGPHYTEYQRTEVRQFHSERLKERTGRRAE